MPLENSEYLPRAGFFKRGYRIFARAAFLPPRFRIIPFMIGLAVLGMGSHAYKIWTGIETGVAHAQDPAAEDHAATTNDTTTNNAAHSETQGTAPAVNPDDRITASDFSDPDNAFLDPLMGMTAGEVQMLERLSERRRELESREQTIREREALLDAAELAFEDKLTELNQIRTDIGGLLEQYATMQEDQLTQIVEIYEKMDAGDAATIFNTLEMNVLIEIIGAMSVSKSAPIMAEMDPLRANQVTTRLAQRHSWGPSLD